MSSPYLNPKSAARPRATRPRPARAPASLATGLLLLSVLTAGCASYEREPLDLAAARHAFLARSPGDESARDFADRLARADARTTGGAIHPNSSGRNGASIFDPSDGLTLAEAEPVALLFNRDLRLARAEARVAGVSAEHAGLWDDPALGIDLERILSSVPDPWIWGASLELTLPVSGRLGIERARAGAEHAAQLARVAQLEWSHRVRVRELWVEWSQQATRRSLLADQIARLESIARIARTQQEAGVLSRLDARLFEVELASARAAALADDNASQELRLQLLDALGLAPDAPVELVAAESPASITIYSSENLADLTLARSTMESSNLELAALQAQHEVAEQSLRLEVRRQYPDLAIAPGFGSEEGDDRLLLGLNLPLPLWNRNQRAIAEARAQRDLARLRFETTYEDLLSRLALAQVRVESARAARESIETTLLPLADSQDEDLRRLEQLGRVEPLLILQTVQSLHEAKLSLLDARAAEATAVLRLIQLIGPPAGFLNETTPQRPDNEPAIENQSSPQESDSSESQGHSYDSRTRSQGATR